MPPKSRSSRVTPAIEEPRGYEFLGPPGAAFISFGLPVLCYVLALSCNDISGCPAPSLLHPTSLSWEQLKQEIGWPGISGLLSTKGVLGALAYHLLNLALYAFLPADTPEGTELRTGGKLKYRFNSFYTALFTMSILAAGTVVEGAEFPVWTFITENYIQLLTSNILIAYILSTYVYVASFTVKHPKDPNQRELAAGGHTGNILYDWFIGRELNPRVTLPVIGEVDIKGWVEVRPGLLGWVILDLAFMMQQYRNFGRVTDSMFVTVIAQTIYAFDCFYMEPAILTTIDIIADGFGIMLAFGNLVWVPFIYSLPAKYLSVYPVELGWTGIAIILSVQATGYYIFRSVNNEKNRFRTNPDDPRIKHLKYIETPTGSKLLITGWWGRARHINYLGDWFMSWSYVLPTAISGYVIQNAAKHPVTASQTDAFFFADSYGKYVVPGEAKGWGMLFTYFFMLYFAVLLVHRERRDEEKCRRKYGKAWEEYCRLVPYRIVPYVY